METNKLTPIEAKTQADYDAIAVAFAESRQGLHWAEIEQEVQSVPAGSAVLDVGCGMGRLYEAFRKREASYTGIDISDKQLEQARRLYPEATFMQGSMLHLPFADATFDAVFSVAAMHHLMTRAERRQAANEALRVLRPGGKVVVSVMGLWQPRLWPLFFKKKAGLATLEPSVRSRIRFTDVFLPWRWKVGAARYRYYHAFRKNELRRLFNDTLLDEVSVRYMNQGRRVLPWKARNLVLAARKRV